MRDPLATDFDSTDISRLVGCCPALQHLTVRLQPDVQLAALSQLAALTALGIRKATKSSIMPLSGLSALKRLTIIVSPTCTPAALLPLTALRQLTYLEAGSVEADGCTLFLQRQVSLEYNQSRPSTGDFLGAIKACHSQQHSLSSRRPPVCELCIRFEAVLFH